MGTSARELRDELDKVHAALRVLDMHHAAETVWHARCWIHDHDVTADPVEGLARLV